MLPVLLLALAPAQQCWGPAIRLPVRQAPPAVVARPGQRYYDGQPHPDGQGWRWSAAWGCWWRVKPAAEAPRAAPAPAPVKIEQAEENFGLDLKEIGKRAHYTLSDRKGSRSVTRERALEAVEKGLPDEARLLRLTVIGGTADRKRVLDDLEGAPALAAWKGKLLVQARAPDDLYLKDRGFVTGGAPVIYCQAPDGRVLGRNHDGAYRGPEALAAGLELAQKRYDPRADPDLWAPKKDDKPAPGPQPAPPALSASWLVTAALAVAVFLLWRRKP